MSFFEFFINHFTQFQQIILTGKLIDEFLRLQTISIYLLLLLVSSFPFLVGFLLCVGMTFAVRRERDWFVLLMPAAVCGCTWSYAHSYCHAMGWFLAFVLVRELVRNPRSKFLWMMLALSAFVLSRWFLAWHGLCAFTGWRFPMSEHAFRCVDSLNSTASLVLAVVFCAWKGKCRA